MIRLAISMFCLLVGACAPTYNSLSYTPLSTTTTTKDTDVFSLLDIVTTTTTTTTVTTTIPEPSAWPFEWLATLELPTDSYWNKVAQCETASNWRNGGQWAGGLGIYLATWRGFGGEEFAPTPDRATRAEQVVVANRIALRGYQNASGATQQPVGFNGWGCIRNNDYLEPTVPNPWTAWRNK